MKTNQFITYINAYEQVFKSYLKNYRCCCVNSDVIISLLSIIGVCRNTDKSVALDVCFDDINFVYHNLNDTSYPKAFYVIILSFFKLINKYYGK